MNKRQTTLLKYFLLGFIVSIFFAACSSSKSSDDFLKNNWKLVSIGEELAIPNIDVTALFDGNGGLSGFAGCNDYIGNYGVSTNQLQINVTKTTSNLCDLPIMTQEKSFLDSLSSASSFEFVDSQDLVTVKNVNGKTLMTLERFTP
jgi:heat shock protein HslJ